MPAARGRVGARRGGRWGTMASLTGAAWPVTGGFEVPTRLDGDAADMDNDGDPDAILGNDANQQNRYWENALGIPTPALQRSTS